MKIRWLKEASASVDAEYEFLAARNTRAARHVFRRIVSTVRRLGEFPLSGRVGRIAGTRELVISGLPYIIIYRVATDRVEILRVFHTAQDASAARH